MVENGNELLQYNAGNGDLCVVMYDKAIHDDYVNILDTIMQESITAHGRLRAKPYPSRDWQTNLYAEVSYKNETELKSHTLYEYLFHGFRIRSIGDGIEAMETLTGLVLQESILEADPYQKYLLNQVLQNKLAD